MLPANAIAGSSFTRTTAGELKIETQDGTIAYKGKPSSKGIQEAFSDEHPMVQQAIHGWLAGAGVFGSGWHFIPVNSPQVCLSSKPRGAGFGRA